jgi:glycosyltransferase involved in cell wall biosynthesis
MPKFSIIIPVYNVESYLRDCLDSVLAQTCADWEAVCVNDGSTDRSLTLLKEYAAKDKRIRIVDQANGGLSAARNAGIKVAHGEYIFLLDSDDWIVQDALERLDKHINGQDLICFSGQKYMEADKTYREPDKLQPATYTSGMDYYNANALLSRDFPFVCTVLRIYRRAFLEENNLRFTEGIYHEDNMFTPFVCYHAQKVTVIPDSLYIYRIRPQSIMTTFNSKRIVDMTMISNTLVDFFSQQSGIDKTIVFRAATHAYQIVLSNPPEQVRKYVLPTLDWHLYFKASRTKLRHRYNFIKLRLKYIL